jgi:DNA-binding transcriptional ArsR family regulator
MEISNALLALNALAQETRLLVFKKLVEFGASGANAGDLARELNVPANTLSFHLAHLERAGLVKSNRVGRNINYAFSRAQMNELIGFLNENCCVREENIDCLNKDLKC